MKVRPGPAVLLSITTLLATAASARAGDIATEDFKPSFPVYASGGTGFTGPWAQGGFNVAAAGYALEDRTLCFPNRATAGASLSGGAFDAINGMLRSLAQPIGQDGTTVYVSLLLEPQSPLGSGIYGGFFGLTLNGSLGSDLFVGKGGGLNEYILETRGGLGQVSGGFPTVAGTTALLVLKVEFEAGNDTFTLYINPVAGDPEPAGGVQKADLDLGLVSAIGIYSSGPFVIDEIRIGTTYGDVSRGTRVRRCRRGSGSCS
jgi:hypothetical protein